MSSEIQREFGALFHAMGAEMARQIARLSNWLAEAGSRYGVPVHPGAALLYCYGRRVRNAAVRVRTNRCV